MVHWAKLLLLALLAQLTVPRERVCVCVCVCVVFWLICIPFCYSVGWFFLMLSYSYKKKILLLFYGWKWCCSTKEMDAAMVDCAKWAPARLGRAVQMQNHCKGCGWQIIDSRIVDLPHIIHLSVLVFVTGYLLKPALLLMWSALYKEQGKINNNNKYGRVIIVRISAMRARERNGVWIQWFML